MNTEEESKKGRRWFVTKFAGRTVLAGLGALTIGRLIGKDGISAQAADGNPLIIGQANSGSSTTFLTSSPPLQGAAAFNVETASTATTAIRGIGLNSAIQGFANSPVATGILGVAASTSPVSGAETPIGVSGFAASPSGTGVFGHAAATSGKTHGTIGQVESPDGVGVFGIASSTNPGTVAGAPIAVAGNTASPTGRGVDGNATAPSGQTIGVSGEAASPDGTGVAGFAASATGATKGVVGTSLSPDGIGVLASNPAGRALQVSGVASFSTVSAGVIPAGQASFTVSDARVTLRSHITVALTGDPGTSPGPGGPPIRASVDWVERNPGVGFTIHLTRVTANDTPFTYLIVEPN